MLYRKCSRCGGHATTLARGRGVVQPHCFECLDRNGDEEPVVRYICSVRDCSNVPVHMAAIDDTGLAFLLLCDQHFRELEPELSVFLELPGWLMDEGDVLLDEEGAVFEVDMDGGWG
jgi:hypothetical protein